MKINEVRELKLEYFNPMVWNLILKRNWLKDYIQVKIDFLGYGVWINIRRNELQQ